MIISQEEIKDLFFTLVADIVDNAVPDLVHVFERNVFSRTAC